VLNTEQASLTKVLENRELSDIISALGCGTGKQFDAGKLRYDKICLLMDADSDGHHICTLLLTFFYRHMRPLIDRGTSSSPSRRSSRSRSASRCTGR
jgi:DNA gyrase subunit B/topoisomerase-4 subunit B